MAFAPVLRLTLAHDYYGNVAPPIKVQPSDPSTFDRAGLLLRQTGQHLTIIADLDEPRPTRVSLNLLSENPDVFAITEGADRKGFPHMSVPLGADRVKFSGLVPEKTETQLRARYLAWLDIDLPADPGSDVRDVTLEFGAVATLWAYHLTGARADATLQVVDPEGEIGFDDIGTRMLPNGKTAQVLRSDRPIPARAHPTRQFALQEPSPFGPKTIMPVLPAAGVQFTTATNPDAVARLQSDIFVNL